MSFQRLIARLAGGVLVLALSLVAPVLLAARLQPDPGQLMFWTRQRERLGLYALDSRRMLTARLTDAPPMHVLDAPRTSRDGQRFVFETLRDGRMSIYVKDARRNPLYVTRSGFEDRLPALSPDGRRVAMWSTRWAQSNPRFQNWYLYVLDVDGSALQQYTYERATLPYDVPSWSPDGRYLIVRFWRGGRDAGMFILDVENGTLRSIRHFVDTGGELIWSPDSQQLAFRAARDRNLEIYVLNLADETAQNLTHHPASDFQPAWSPDNRQIAFVSNRDGDGQLYLMDIDGGNVRQLTTDGGWQPSWSPTGKQLAFVSHHDDREALYVIAADGTGLRLVAEISNQMVFAGWLLLD